MNLDNTVMTLEEAILARHSVRAYKPDPIPEEIRSQLDAAAAEVNQESGLNIQMIYDMPEGFDSRLAQYGAFKNVNHFILLKGKDRVNFEEACGYYGEKLVLIAQMLGLNTCWAALTFNKKAVEKLIPEGERFCMVISLGYGINQGRERKSKSLQDVVATKGTMPDWFKKGAEAALLAPTAVNQQKFVMGMKLGKPVIRISGPGFHTKTDLGIVKYHFEVASGHKVW